MFDSQTPALAGNAICRLENVSGQLRYGVFLDKLLSGDLTSVVQIPITELPMRSPFILHLSLLSKLANDEEASQINILCSPLVLLVHPARFAHVAQPFSNRSWRTAKH